VFELGKIILAIEPDPVDGDQRCQARQKYQQKISKLARKEE
jgi:hypothetical protein